MSLESIEDRGLDSSRSRVARSSDCRANESEDDEVVRFSNPDEPKSSSFEEGSLASRDWAGTCSEVTAGDVADGDGLRNRGPGATRT